MAPSLVRLLLVLVGVVFPAFAQSELTKLENLRLLEGTGGDADSFQVSDGTQSYHLRLYLVDAPETAASDPSLARRVREQTRYFGLPSPADTLRHGAAARARTRELLSKPFSAYTSGARGLGRSSEPRVYAYVITADGLDLGEQLVREGLARAFGVGRVNPAGVSQQEQRSQLADLEFAAALARRGIWADSDPEKIAAARAEERADAAELAAVAAAAAGADPLPSADGENPAAGSARASSDSAAPGQLLDLNTATLAQLRTLPGVGPVLAQRIFDARPFRSVLELDAVQGIGPTVFNRLRPLVTVSSDAGATPPAEIAH